MTFAVRPVMGLLATLCLGARAIAAQEPGDSGQLVQLEQRWNEAHRRGDANALDQLWAADLVVMVPGMAPMGKSDALTFARSGRMRFDHYETSQLRLRLYGNAAVVTGRLERTRRLGGRSASDDWQFTKVYVREARTWRVVAFAASPSPP